MLKYAFLQFLDVQDVRKIMRFSPNKSIGKFYALFKIVES